VPSGTNVWVVWSNTLLAGHFQVGQYDRRMKKFGIVLSIVVFTLLASGVPVEAASYSVPRTETERQQLIIKLLKEVVRLQKLLADKLEKENAGREPYESVLFSLPIETMYFVDRGQLVPARGGAVRPVDQEVFTLFRNVLGEAAVAKYVDEWRVFNIEDSAIDAAVESIGDTGRYVVSVNRAGYSDRTLTQRSFANLFIHEYSHLLFFERPEFVADYTDAFWSRADKAHSAAVAGAASSRQATLLRSYFEANTDRFVTDYATVSPDEDMAETFVAFVVNAEKPAASSIKNQKIRNFYTDQTFVSVRNTLRSNLSQLGL
jgi:hypothetical protein